jgi:poly-gamma-glutamate synthesis protein (capsule biosynthesis protein)
MRRVTKYTAYFAVVLSVSGLFALLYFFTNTSGDVSIYSLPKWLGGSSIVADTPVKIFVGGDIMLDRNVRNKIDASGFDSVFGDIRGLVAGDDIVVANLEGPFTSSPSITASLVNKALQFTFDPALAPKMREAGFTMLGLANNHTENFGTAGLVETRRHLSDANIQYYGDPENTGSQISTTTTVRGITVAFIGFHQFSNKGLQNVYDEITRLRPLADFIIVSPHWGIEYQATSTEYQQRVAHAFIDHGADAVIGTHPHVVEPLEIYNGKPIFYSLGNFVFDQNFSFETTHALALEIDLSRASATVSAHFNLIPITIDSSHTELASSTISAQVLENLGTTNGLK